jgi:DNA replication and repair protein RecF
MLIEHIDCDGFRNLRDVNIELSPGINVLYGDNGEGKTSLLEAIWIMTGVKSFRGVRDRDIFGFNAKSMTAGIIFVDRERRQIVTALYHPYPKGLLNITANGVKLPTRISALFGRLKAVVFTPEDLALAYGEPLIRRSFCNLSISQIRPAYAGVLARYNRVLAQRNAYLKESQNTDTEIWDSQLAKLGAHISMYRDVYVKMLDRAAGEIYEEISGGKERLSVRFHSTAYKPDETEFTAETYYKSLVSHAEEERRYKTTLIGVHRDDIVLTLDNKPVREFASQGQQRSVALSLKLAAAKILAVEDGECPIVLLDDVLSELDAKRRTFLLKNLDGFQTIITSCEEIPLPEGGRKFYVKNGEIEENPPRGRRPRYPR